MTHDAAVSVSNTFVSNFNSNWTFIAFNLPNSMGTLRRNKTKKNSQQSQ